MEYFQLVLLSYPDESSLPSESLLWFSFGVQENLSEKWSFTEIASLQVVSQSVDFYQMSLLTSLRPIDLLSPSTVTAKRNQQFNASSAESFHRKLTAETLPSSNAPIQRVATNNV